MDLLLHEVGVLAQLDGVGCRVDVHDRGRTDLGAGRIPQAMTVRGQLDDLAVAQVDDVLREVGKGGGITREHADPVALRAVPHTGDEGRSVGQSGHTPGEVAADRHDGILADEPGLDRSKELAEGGLGVRLMGFLQQVHDHLAVGLTREAVPPRLQTGAQLVVVLDDAVVGDGEMASAMPAAEVRVGVLLGDGAVGRPARVADPCLAGDVLLHPCAERVELPSGAAEL